MDVQSGPNEVDEPNLLYKLQRKIKVFNTNNPLRNRGYNLVTCSSRYGIVFVASPNSILSVYYLKELIDKECEPQFLNVNIPIQPTHIAVNCNHEWLAVIGGQMLLVYKCMDFCNPGVRPSVTIKCDINPATFVSSLQWNPCIPDTIGIVFFDGTLLVCQVSTMQMKKIQSNARCICWSPKGKQLVTGNNDGTLTQYKPDLSPMKMVPKPKLFEGAPVEALAIYWISTYQFAVTFRNANDATTRPAVTIVNTPKGGTPSCYNYEDICYSMSHDRPWYYYLQGLAPWNMILLSSSNSMELATLSTADGCNWVQWCQTDEARPELPMTDKKQENFPVGICLDTTAIHQLPMGEGTLPPMPLLHVLSQTGQLTIFNIINIMPTAQQICTQPQPIALPANALTRNIPDDVPSQPEPQPVIAQPKPQPPKVQPQPIVQAKPQPVLQVPNIQQPVIQPQPIIPEPQVHTIIAPVKTIPQQVTTLQPNKAATQPAPAENPISVPQPKPSVPKPQAPTPEISAALKSEQEKINKAKVDQELKNMLIKEVNDFQIELYQFMKVTHDKREKFHRDIQSINLNVELDMDTEKLRKECAIEDLRDTVTQLKLELVRACAVIAESRTHAEAKDQREWTQTDPLTAKRIASVKKLAYYVQNQLDQALKAFDHKWNEDANKDLYTKPGERMIRPILDEVYQPLVKQQEILSRQQAELKALRKAMNDCNITPIFRSTTLLRSTPFRNKDPLSKLTKNILNMNIEPRNKEKEQLLNSQKLDALRDVLSNHKPNKIKPINFEITQHLENMRQRYIKGLKEKEEKSQQPIEVELQQELKPTIKQENPKEYAKQQFNYLQMPIKTEQKGPSVPSLNTQNNLKNDGNMFLTQKIGAPVTYGFTQPLATESKPDIVKGSSIITPSYTPVNLKPTKPVPSVARTLFTDEPNDKPLETIQKPQAHSLIQQAMEQTKQPNLSQGTKILLRQMILKDNAASGGSAQTEPKNDANTFMGQNICSPNAFNFSKSTTTDWKGSPTQRTKPKFVPKPTSDANLSKLQTQTKPESEVIVTSTVNPKSNETGEPEAGALKKLDKPKEEKPITNMFTLKNSTPLISKNQNVPDVLKSSSQGFVFSKIDNKTFSKAEEKTDKIKENVPSKSVDAQPKPVADNKTDNELKPLVAPMSSIAPAQSVIIVDLKKPAAEAKVEKVPSSVFSGAPISPPPTVPQLEAETVSQRTTVFEASTIPENLSKSITITPVAKDPVINQSNIVPDKPTISNIAETKDELKMEKTETNELNNASTNITSDVFSSAPSEQNASLTEPTKTPTSDPKPIVFSSPTPSSPVFSSTTPTLTSQPSAFAPNASSVFASASAAAFGSQTTPPSIFGTATTTPSMFGTTTTSSIFGGTSSAQSLFSAAASKSMFGSTPASTTQSIFGTSSVTSQASVFAGTQSVFGAPSSPGFGTPSTQASIFGTPLPATQASVFGTPTQTTQTSIFGTPTASQPSVFGSPSTTQSGSPFGNTETNMFAAASISATSANSQTSGGNIFGGSPGSVFGNSNTNTNVFGSKASFTGSNPTATSIFSGGTAFGQKPATDFWSGGSSNAFGSSGFGQQATTQASSIFGSTGGSFSSPGQPFGSPGPFSGGEAKSVFGSPQQQSAPGGFGGSPVFGSKPVFGGSPSFGSSAFGGFNKSPTSGFGSPASFGGTAFGAPAFGNASPDKGFGNTSPGFGSPTQSNATFENLATQNTLTFGNLAQQSGQPQPAPTFNANPSFTGWRG